VCPGALLDAVPQHERDARFSMQHLVIPCLSSAATDNGCACGLKGSAPCLCVQVPFSTLYPNASVEAISLLERLLVS
jgi:hypothetical protein